MGSCKTTDLKSLILPVIMNYYNCFYFQFTVIYGGLLWPNDWADTTKATVGYTDMTFCHNGVSKLVKPFSVQQQYVGEGGFLWTIGEDSLENI